MRRTPARSNYLRKPRGTTPATRARAGQTELLMRLRRLQEAADIAVGTLPRPEGLPRRRDHRNRRRTTRDAASANATPGSRALAQTFCADRRTTGNRPSCPRPIRDGLARWCRRPVKSNVLAYRYRSDAKCHRCSNVQNLHFKFPDFPCSRIIEAGGARTSISLVDPVRPSSKNLPPGPLAPSDCSSDCGSSKKYTPTP